MNLAAGLLLAICSATALNSGFFLQHAEVSGLAQLSLRRPLHSLFQLCANVRWLAGYGLGLLGWGLYIAALHFAALSMVQATSAGGIGILAVLVHRWGISRLGRIEILGTVVGLAGLVLLALSLLGGVPASKFVATDRIAIAVGAILGAGALLALVLGRVLGEGIGLGTGAGCCYAAGDIATKGAVGGSGVVFVPVLLACSLLGFVALQCSFQRGGALATAGTANLVTNAIPIALGVVLFDERLPGGALGVSRVIGFVLVICAAALVGRGEVQRS